jgi:2,5-diketo-D-gluconate reductase A
VLGLAVVARMAEELGRTPAQVVLAWHLELGLVTVPKSSDPVRLRQNLEAVDVRLGTEQLDALSALDQGEAAAVDSDVFGH